MIASEIVARREQPDVGRHPPAAAIVSVPRPAVTSMSAETGQLAAIARRMKEANRVAFKSTAEAEAAGYRKAKGCK